MVASDTDRLGSFRIFEVAPGPYTVRVRGLGYAEYSQEIVIGPTETVELDLRLLRSALQIEGISVEAERSRTRVRFEQVGGATRRDLDVDVVRAVPSLARARSGARDRGVTGRGVDVRLLCSLSRAGRVSRSEPDPARWHAGVLPVPSRGVFSVFNADMIDRVELYSGGFSAEHGGRVSSVLQVESDAGDGDFSVDGAVSLIATRVAVGGGLGSSIANALGFANLRYRVSARRSYLDLLVKEAPYHLTDFQGIVEGWTPGDDRLTLTAYKGRDVFDLTTGKFDDFPLQIDWDWGNDAFGVRWTHPRRGGGSLDVRANFSRFSTGLIFPDFADTRLSSRITQGQYRADLDLRPSARVSVQVGASVEGQSYKNLFSSGGTEFGTGIGDAWLVGTYAQTRWSPRGWLVELGLRADGYSPDPGDWAQEIAPRLAVKRFLGGGRPRRKGGGRPLHTVRALAAGRGAAARPRLLGAGRGTLPAHDLGPASGRH